MVEAAGRLVRLFQDGPDYAFTLGPKKQAKGAERVIHRRVPMDPSAGSPLFAEVSRSMSLYRAGLRLALFLPLGVALASRGML